MKIWESRELQELEDEYHRRLAMGDWAGAQRVAIEANRLRKEILSNEYNYISANTNTETLPKKKKIKKTTKKAVSKKDLKNLANLLGTI